MAKIKTAEARQQTLERVRRSTLPTLTGRVAIELDCSLAEAEAVLEGLVSEGLIRPVTEREMQDHDVRGGYLPV